MARKTKNHKKRSHLNLEKAMFRTQATVDHDAKSTRIVLNLSILRPEVTSTRDSDGRKVVRAKGSQVEE